MISIIYCSIDAARSKFTREMYEKNLPGVDHEIIAIHDAKSMCEAYNRGIARARGEILIFSHDDIEIVTPDFHERLVSRLKTYDLIGLAGTTRMCGPYWFA